MKDWHRSDIFDALAERGWKAPVALQVSTDEASYVGEAYTLVRDGENAQMYFVADYGTGFDGADSIEARDSNWRRQLLFWVNRVSGMAVPEIREPNLPPIL